MKKTLLTAITVGLISFSLSAQGLIFDSTQFSSREGVEETRSELPLRASFKPYTPILYPQVGGTCVAHSFSNARTILLAKSLGWTDKKKITSLSFSPYYIYYRNKSNNDQSCEQGLNIETAAKDVLRNGFAPITEVEYPNYYPFSNKALCIENSGISYPPSMIEDAAAAKNYKIDEIYKVSSVNQLKTALSSGMPVVLCMFVPNSFNKVKGEVWTPQSTDRFDRNSGHAILAVGYDDTKYGGAIELMNSWGDTWGNKGFIWVKYKDYLKWFVGGYAFSAEEELTMKSAGKSNPTSAKAVIRPNTMKMKSGSDRQTTIDFNNAEFLKAFRN